MKKCMSISKTPVQKALDVIRTEIARGAEGLTGLYQPQQAIAVKQPIRVECRRHGSFGEAMMRQAIRRYAENEALGREGELR